MKHMKQSNFIGCTKRWGAGLNAFNGQRINLNGEFGIGDVV
jgi:hypothetical protein